ncbi:MAG TPA: hypothetical protein VGP63_23755 [Planctomycetaceae bacterium]|nr:hypothetical protein [Planctomycetaceae bacterium]
MSDELMTDKPDGKRWGIALRRGTAIGLFSGMLTGPIMLVWLLAYSFARPNPALGSTAILGPISGGIATSILGLMLGAVAGAVVGLFGIQLAGRRCVLFGVILMAIIGILEAFIDCANSPERFAAWFAMVIGMDLVCPILAGAAIGRLYASRTTDRS